MDDPVFRESERILAKVCKLSRARATKRQKMSARPTQSLKRQMQG